MTEYNLRMTAAERCPHCGSLGAIGPEWHCGTDRFNNEQSKFCAVVCQLATRTAELAKTAEALRAARFINDEQAVSVKHWRDYARSLLIQTTRKPTNTTPAA